jgi:hypothetical protein
MMDHPRSCRQRRLALRQEGVDLRGVASIVDDDEFPVLERLSENVIERPSQQLGPILGPDDDRDARLAGRRRHGELQIVIESGAENDVERAYR